ncbi:MauE/DoxX family redox-associated membrane protein [Epilithonimonas sp.]|uniref:MauE/DoxX family redox-associated membrane protein n=1 Tax=Epilithonimonas sp. TaxID=2894511 RepID=UPI0028999F86|nr:MauE/DoxX family redox-associated membrane protein [Epilithonimonas sp.]
MNFKIKVMKNFQNILIKTVSYFFILLFVYASVSKILDFENFQVQIAQSPVLTSYAGFISYGVIILELLLALGLYFEKTRNIALLASTVMMSSFTIYIYIILNYSEFVPCSCGGILEKLGWWEHLIFNMVCVVIGAVAYFLARRSDLKPKLQTVIILCSANLGFAMLVAFLFLSSEYLIKNENNFTRRFLPHPITEVKEIDLRSKSFYFAGNSGDSLFLGNRQAPRIMATVLPGFTRFQLDTLVLNDYKLPFKNVELNVNYPFYSLSDGTVPVLFEGIFPNKLAIKSKYPIPFYSKIKMAEPYHYIVRTTLSENRESVMGTYNSKNGNTQLKPEILEKQVDGLFDTDGEVVIEVQEKKMIYTYYYRNEYIITDLHLHNKKSGHTIDTIRRAQIHVKNLENGLRKMSAPPLEVNQMQTVYQDLLFNVARLRGKYESKNRWKEANIIDVYNYKSKTYQYSFYVYHNDGNKIRDLRLTKNYLYVLAGNKLIRHQRRL